MMTNSMTGSSKHNTLSWICRTQRSAELSIVANSRSCLPAVHTASHLSLPSRRSSKDRHVRSLPSQAYSRGSVNIIRLCFRSNRLVFVTWFRLSILSSFWDQGEHDNENSLVGSSVLEDISERMITLVSLSDYLSEDGRPVWSEEKVTYRRG